jgi:hypothetical protein
MSVVGPTDRVPLEERMERADLWEAAADERERLADERERLADERDAIADEREAMADRHDHVLDRREADAWPPASSDGESDEAAEASATQAALHRAEAGVLRAQANLQRVRRAAARIGARAARRVAASERVAAADHDEDSLDAEERAWLADRRDFVAADRDTIAGRRDTIADQRDETAGRREHLADNREHDSLDRERRIDQRRRGGHPATTARLPAGQEPSLPADLRAEGERQRKSAAASRRAAAQERGRAAATWGPQAYGPTLVASFAQLARQLFGSEDLTDVLPPVLKFTVGAVAGCDCASVTLWRHGQVLDTVSSDVVAAELDHLQFGTGIGPSPEALHGEHPVYVPRLADSPRWPALAATATQLGMASALCHGLFVHQQAQWSALGVLNLYSAVPDAFSDDDQEFASILGAYVSVAVAMAHRRDEVDHREAALHRGLSTRDVIGQAKGILMERQRLSAGDAFDVLRRASQRLNRKLADVAEHLTETGELPT